jgi:hypothetical protein
VQQARPGSQGPWTAAQHGTAQDSTPQYISVHDMLASTPRLLQEHSMAHHRESTAQRQHDATQMLTCASARRRHLWAFVDTSMYTHCMLCAFNPAAGVATWCTRYSRGVPVAKLSCVCCPKLLLLHQEACVSQHLSVASSTHAGIHAESRSIGRKELLCQSMHPLIHTHNPTHKVTTTSQQW